jgi:hypothetical protein
MSVEICFRYGVACSSSPRCQEALLAQVPERADGKTRKVGPWKERVGGGATEVNSMSGDIRINS